VFHTQSNARRERAVRLQFIREHDNAIDVMAASMRPARHIQSSAVRSVMRLRPLLGPLLSLLMLMPGGAHAQRTSMARGHSSRGPASAQRSGRDAGLMAIPWCSRHSCGATFQGAGCLQTGTSQGFAVSIYFFERAASHLSAASC
jgi:hypothetical protein